MKVVVKRVVTEGRDVFMPELKAGNSIGGLCKYFNCDGTWCNTCVISADSGKGNWEALRNIVNKKE